KLLILMRGLPGSGKTSLAKQLRANGVIYSTDDFFVNNGNYEFDLMKLSDAHEWNKKRALKAMEEGISPVIIDNTNTQSWEMRPYVLMAQRLGYKVIIREPSTHWKWKPKQLFKNNTHGVGLDKIKSMLERYEHNMTIEKILNEEQ
ncbi:predicted protein, partial [Nematostella vectensis]